MKKKDLVEIVSEMSADTPPAAPVIPKEKLLNKKYYRTVNIDLVAEEKVKAKVVADKKKKADDEEAAAAEAVQKEHYKTVLRGMGFNV